jgi:hypothetical protein
VCRSVGDLLTDNHEILLVLLYNSYEFMTDCIILNSKCPSVLGHDHIRIRVTLVIVIYPKLPVGE